MVQQTKVHSNYKTQLNNKNECTIDRQNNLEINAELKKKKKKPTSKNYILYFFQFM